LENKECWNGVFKIYQDENIRSKDKFRLFLLYSLIFPKQWIKHQNQIDSNDLEGFYEFARIHNHNEQSTNSNLNLNLNLNLNSKPTGSVNNVKRPDFVDEPEDYFYFSPNIKTISKSLIRNKLDQNTYSQLSEITNDYDGGGIFVIFICGGITYSEINAIHDVFHETRTPVIIGSDMIIRY
jgi:hypothetical protein